MNRHERRARQARGEIPKGYVQDIQRGQRALVRWLFEHPSAQPLLAMPAQEVMLIAGLSEMRDKCGLNDDGKSLLDALIAIGPGERELTVFMCRIILQTIGVEYEVRPSTYFSEGYRMVPLAPGGKA